VRDQIEDLLHSTNFDQAVQKVDHLSRTVGEIASSCCHRDVTKKAEGRLSGMNTKTPHVDSFNRSAIELGKVVRACHSPLRFEPNDMNADLISFLEAASGYLLNEFIPKDALYAGQNGKCTPVRG
jgi:hypothetical protein